MKKILVGLFLLAIPTLAWAVTPNAWTKPCASDTADPSRNQVVSPTDQACYKFDEGHNTTGTGIGSAHFEVRHSRASVNLNRDLATSAGSIVAELLPCPLPPPYTAARCGPAITPALDTAVGMVWNVTRGHYALNVTTAVSAGQDAVLSVRGYE